jgi:hypothetical protein
MCFKIFIDNIEIDRVGKFTLNKFTKNTLFYISPIDS